MDMIDHLFLNIRAQTTGETFDLVKKLQELVATERRDAARFRRALAAYKNGTVQSSDGNGYVSVFLEAIRDEPSQRS